MFVWQLDLVPDADYFTSAMLGLDLPLLLIGAAQIVYAVFLIFDMIRLQGKRPIVEVLLCIGVWYGVMYLFFAVYICRVIVFVRRLLDLRRTEHLLEAR